MSPHKRRNEKIRKAIIQIHREGGTGVLSLKEMSDLLEKKIGEMAIIGKMSLSVRTVGKIMGEYPFVERIHTRSARFVKIGESEEL